jgi:hypothetical protein
LVCHSDNCPALGVLMSGRVGWLRGQTASRPKVKLLLRTLAQSLATCKCDPLLHGVVRADEALGRAVGMRHHSTCAEVDGDRGCRSTEGRHQPGTAAGLLSVQRMFRSNDSKQPNPVMPSPVLRRRSPYCPAAASAEDPAGMLRVTRQKRLIGCYRLLLAAEMLLEPEPAELRLRFTGYSRATHSGGVGVLDAVKCAAPIR